MNRENWYFDVELDIRFVTVTSRLLAGGPFDRLTNLLNGLSNAYLKMAVNSEWELNKRIPPGPVSVQLVAGFSATGSQVGKYQWQEGKEQCLSVTLAAWWSSVSIDCFHVTSSLSKIQN